MRPGWLLTLYTAGENVDTMDYQVHLHDIRLWNRVTVLMMRDPYSEHEHAFFSIKNVQEEYE